MSHCPVCSIVCAVWTLQCAPSHSIARPRPLLSSTSLSLDPLYAGILRHLSLRGELQFTNRIENYFCAQFYFRKEFWNWTKQSSALRWIQVAVNFVPQCVTPHTNWRGPANCLGGTCSTTTCPQKEKCLVIFTIEYNFPSDCDCRPWLFFSYPNWSRNLFQNFRVQGSSFKFY